MYGKIDVPTIPRYIHLITPTNYGFNRLVHITITVVPSLLFFCYQPGIR